MSGMRHSKVYSGDRRGIITGRLKVHQGLQLTPELWQAEEATVTVQQD